MEIPVINRIGEFDAGITSLPNANFLSQILPSISFTPTQGFSHTHHFLKWSALIIALVATFSGLVRRFRIFVVSLSSRTHPLSQPFLNRVPENDDRFYGENIDEPSSSSWSDQDDYDDSEEPASASGNWERTNRDFNVRGSARFSADSERDHCLKLRRRFSWSDLAPGKSVVKIWENLRFEIDVDDLSGNDQISIYDINKEQKTNSIFCGKSLISSFSASPRPMIVSAGTETSGDLSVKLWDNRTECQIPAIIAEWKPRLVKIVSAWSGDFHKLYVGDNVTGDITVGDARNVLWPVQSLRERDVETWWDADAVIFTE